MSDLREHIARTLYVADVYGREYAEQEWDELTLLPPTYEQYRRMADAVLALIPTPRVVTTVAELEALPVETVVRDADQYLWAVAPGKWFLDGGDRNTKVSAGYVTLPAAVLTPAPEREPVTAEQAWLEGFRAALGDESPQNPYLANVPVTDEEAGT